MVAQRLSIFEVLNNFLGSQDCPQAERLNNRNIRDLREHVINFYGAYEIPARNQDEERYYLGGFLSSPLFPLETSPYISSALLCADSLVLFDPLHYWFCEEQYKREQLLTALPGWIDWQTKRPDYGKTKLYLGKILPWLYRLRPLVDAGIVVFIPAEQIVYSSLAEMKDLESGITGFVQPLESLTDKFSPDEITVDDNRKGLFVFAGGEREKQIQKALGRGFQQFAKDVVIAKTTGSIYTAPFRWEQHLGKLVFDGFAVSEYHTAVIECVRNLRLPILTNLSPEVLTKIHKDSSYAEFLAELSGTFRSINAEIGSQDFADRVAQIERDLLLPKVEAVHREVQSSVFKTATKALVEGFLVSGQSFLSRLPTGMDPGVNLEASFITGGLSFLRKMYEGIVKSQDHRIWAQLLPEKPSLSVYGPPLTLRQKGAVGWEIDKRPSVKVKVAMGVIKCFIDVLLSWNGETTPNVDLETEIRAASAAGFGGVEIFVPKLAPYLEKHTARDLGRTLRDANLVPVSLNGLEHVNLRTRTDFAHLKAECVQLAQIAAECGCRDIVVVPDPRPPGMSDADVIAQSADELRELVEVAAPFGVTLAFEFLAPANCSVRTLAMAQKIVERAASHPPLSRTGEGRGGGGIVFDTFHFFVGGSAMTEITPAATRLIRLVHINDVESKPREAMTDADRLLPGEGVLPLDAMLRALAANGYDGAYSLEVMRPAYRTREIGEYMADARRKTEAVLSAIAKKRNSAKLTSNPPSP